MADNIQITAGAGTTVATDEVGGKHYQRVKPVYGADGVVIDVSSANPFPVALLGDAIDNLRSAISTLNRRTSYNTFDSTGRQRVLLDSTSALGTVSTVSTVSTVAAVTAVSTVTTVSTVNAVTTVGGLTNMGQGLNTFELVRAASRTAYNTGVRARLSFS